MDRLTKRIDLGNGKSTVDFSNEKCGEFLTDHAAGVRALFEKLADYEDAEEKALENLDAYFSLENWLYEQKEKPVEIKSAMLWGGLFVMNKMGYISWDEMRKLYGEFMSKIMNLR